MSRVTLGGVRPVSRQRDTTVVFLALFLLMVGCTSRSGENDFVTLPVGAALPSGKECAARIPRDQRETQPENTAANHFVPARVVMPIWDDFTEQANQRFVPRIDGEFTGTTSEILTWSACKWGLDADILRAVAVQESHWLQSTVSDESNNATDLDTKPWLNGPGG